MISLAVTLVIVAAVLYIWTDARPLIQRRITVSEIRASIEQQRVDTERIATVKPAVTDDDPMPREFVDWAMQESSEWAREDKLARMRELHSRLQNWEKVRRALMAEEDAALKSTF
jgi:hypothetical protein